MIMIMSCHSKYLSLSSVFSVSPSLLFIPFFFYSLHRPRSPNFLSLQLLSLSTMHATDLGDHIGMESCVDLEIDTATPLTNSAPLNRKPWGMSRRSSFSETKRKKLPPPMPIQTSTVMKRYYTDDGRLIITEEKVESPKCVFTAHRSHGRLTLQLVDSDSVYAVENKSSSAENREGIDVYVKNECSVNNKVAIGGGGDGSDGGNRGGRKCFSYNTAVRVAATGSCLFVNQNRQFQAIRPVKI